MVIPEIVENKNLSFPNDRVSSFDNLQTPITPDSPISQTPKEPSKLQQISKISTLPYYKPNSNAIVRVFAFHGSGGSALSYNRWISNDKIEFCSIEIPGHGTRKSEKVIDSLHELTKKIGEELGHNLSSNDIVVYVGFSFGAYLAFEVATYLLKYYHINIYHFFPISRAPPHHDWMDENLRENIKTNWTDTEIVEYMANVWNLPKLNKILKFSEPDRSEMSKSVAILQRADMLMGGENKNEIIKLNCPITAIYGFNDTAYPKHLVEMWKDYTYSFEIFGVNSNHENMLMTKDTNNIVINKIIDRITEDFPNNI